MKVVMQFEIKVKPEYVSFLKQSFDECRAKVLEQEPGCLDYSLFQSYNDSTLFCLTEAWTTKGDHNYHMQLAHTKKNISETKGIRDPSLQTKGKRGLLFHHLHIGQLQGDGNKQSRSNEPNNC